MSMEICKLCEEECTPWKHIDGHICLNCYTNKHRWVSVKDRLPQNGVNVLICTEPCKKMQVSQYLGNIWSIDSLPVEFYHKLLKEEQVTHWIPLPFEPQD